jgi:membrane protein
VANDLELETQRCRGCPDFFHEGKGHTDAMVFLMIWVILKTAVAQWFRHRSARLGAALAFYSVFSMGPLLLLVVAISGLFFGADAVRGSLSGQFRSLLGPIGSQAIEAMLAGASSKPAGHAAALVGVFLILISAVGVVAQLKDAMNTIWNVEDPGEVSIWWYARTYLVSFAGVLALGFLLTIALVLSATLSAISNAVGGEAAAASTLWEAINFIVSLAILAALFAMLFKWFPDTEVAWQEVWFGAIVTALLFNIGKLVIGWYVGSQGLESTYGAAASIIVLLIWVYYSAQIVLFGAELTHAYSAERGSRRRQSPDSVSAHKADTAA